MVSSVFNFIFYSCTVVELRRRERGWCRNELDVGRIEKDRLVVAAFLKLKELADVVFMDFHIILLRNNVNLIIES